MFFFLKNISKNNAVTSKSSKDQSPFHAGYGVSRSDPDS